MTTVPKMRSIVEVGVLVSPDSSPSLFRSQVITDFFAPPLHIFMVSVHLRMPRDFVVITC